MSYRSSATYPNSDRGAGRKGGRKRKTRVYLNAPEEPQVKKNEMSNPFTEVWHNNEPLVLTRSSEVPAEKRCGHCGGEFPRGILACRPFDIALSHSERWQYLNRQRSEPSEPKYLPSHTTRYYCIKRNCIFKRFPYFKSQLLLVPENMELWPSHKKLLKEQLDVQL